jgi:hypothetical protein
MDTLCSELVLQLAIGSTKRWPHQKIERGNFILGSTQYKTSQAGIKIYKTRPDLSNSQRNGRSSASKFFSSRNWVWLVQKCVHTGESSWNANCTTPEHDTQQHNRPNVCLIAKRYSSTTFVSMRTFQECHWILLFNFLKLQSLCELPRFMKRMSLADVNEWKVAKNS